MFRALLALSLLATPTAPPDYPRLFVKDPIAYKVCGEVSGVTVGVDLSLSCPDDPTELLGAMGKLVAQAAENQKVSTELFKNSVVAFVPFVLTNCSKDPADDNDYAGCTEPPTGFSMVSLLTSDSADVAVHELEHTAIHRKEQKRRFPSKKHESAAHEKLDADRLAALKKKYSLGD